MGAYTTPTTSSVTSTARGNRWQMLGGDRFFAFARLVVLALLFVVGNLLADVDLLSVGGLRTPFGILLSAYALFSMLMVVALFVPGLERLLRVGFVVDILFISLLIVFSNLTIVNRGLFFPLYLLPLVGAAIRLRESTSLFAGVIAAILYVGAVVVLNLLTNGTPPTSLLDIVTLGLLALTLVFIPWLASGLAERWSANNRLSVELAQRQTESALREAQAYRDRSRALYEVAYSLSTTMNYQTVMHSALIESQRLVPYTYGMVLLSTGNPDELYIIAAQGLHSSYVGQRMMFDKGIMSQILRSKDAQIINEIGQEPALAPLGIAASARSGCCVPLRAGLRTYGLMIICSDRPSGFTHEQLEMVSALSGYAIIALQNAQLVQDLREERSKLLSKEEEVRRQLARDLHDGPAQALAAITMNLEFIKRLLTRDPSRVPDELEKLSALSRRTTHEVRTMLFELRPLVLETQGLAETLSQYLDRFQNAGTKIVLESEDLTDVHLDTRTEGTLFNIVQESINNALKHAKAAHIWVRMKRNGDVLEATVQDDGRGFDLEKVRSTYEQRGSFGLLNIVERAKLVGGTAEMHSAPGEGTTVRVFVPISVM